jgi:DNA-binding transcriptional LysR family regulator
VTDIRQLRQFIAVAEELHFRRAAERLHMTQPPLTQAMQSLEASLEVTLFDRTRKSVTLTPGGEALLAYARHLIRASDELPRIVKAAAEGQTGRLRVAFASTVAYGRMPGWVSGFRHANPDVLLELREATLDVQLKALGADQVDAGFILHALGAAPVGFSALTLLVEPFLVALPVNHRLANRESISFADVASDPVVIFPRQIMPSLFDALLSYYHLKGITPHIEQEAIEMQTIVSLVAAGMGIAWVPQVFARFARPGVVYRHVQDMPVSIETSLIWNSRETPIVDRFVSHIRSAPNLSPPVFDPIA